MGQPGSGCVAGASRHRHRAHHMVLEGRAVPALPMMGAEALYVSSEGNLLTKPFLPAVEVV